MEYLRPQKTDVFLPERRKADQIKIGNQNLQQWVLWHAYTTKGTLGDRLTTAFTSLATTEMNQATRYLNSAGITSVARLAPGPCSGRGSLIWCIINLGFRTFVDSRDGNSAKTHVRGPWLNYSCAKPRGRSATS